MNGALLRKSLHESRLLWLACAVVLFLFCWVHVLVTSQVDMGRFESLLNTIPEQWEKFSPVPFKKLISYPARISIIYEEPLVYLLMGVWCISRSSDVVSGELGRGTMEMLLAQPVSRLQILLTPVCVTLVGVILLASVAWLGTCMGIASTSVERPPVGSGWSFPLTLFPQTPVGDEASRIPMRQLAPFRQFLPAAANYLCLGVFLSGTCTLLSSMDRDRWRTIGVMVGFYVVSMLAEVVGHAFPSLAWIRQLSFLRIYEPIRFVSESTGDASSAWAWFLRDGNGAIIDIGPLMCNALLLGLGGLGLAAAAIVFCRRDLPPPI